MAIHLILAGRGRQAWPLVVNSSGAPPVRRREGPGLRRKEMLGHRDLTAARRSPRRSVSSQNLEMQQLGGAASCWTRPHHHRRGGDKAAIEGRKQIRAKRPPATTTARSWKKRLASSPAGGGDPRGGAVRVEMKPEEALDRPSPRRGDLWPKVVPGAGLALLRHGGSGEGGAGAETKRTGLQILKRALGRPRGARPNSDVDGASWRGRMGRGHFGFDSARRGTWTWLPPASSTRPGGARGLENAVSVASLLLLTEPLTEVPEEERPGMPMQE